MLFLQRLTSIVLAECFASLIFAWSQHRDIKRRKPSGECWKEHSTCSGMPPEAHYSESPISLWSPSKSVSSNKLKTFRKTSSRFEAIAIRFLFLFGTSASLLVTSALLVVTRSYKKQEATRNKCHATRSKCLTSSNKKLQETRSY